MELNKKMVVKVAVLLFLMGFSATVEAGRINPSFIISKVLSNGDASYLPSTSTKDCCESCICLWPSYECWCVDVFEYCCPSSCKHCDCTNSDPPLCRCLDSAHHACPIPKCA